MNLRLKNRSLLKIQTGAMVCLALAAIVFLTDPQRMWSVMDYKVLDGVYQAAADRGYGPKASQDPAIIYLTLTDDTYRYFNKNYLDRKDLARLNNALDKFNPALIVYDIIFPFPSSPDADAVFAASLKNNTPFYMPTALSFSESPGEAPKKAVPNCWSGIRESGRPTPFHTRRILGQHQPFEQAASGSGNISAMADSDGFYRHMPLISRVNKDYYPTLGLSVYMGWSGIRPESVEIEWGRQIRIPLTGAHGPEKELDIPIDPKGRMFIPFVAPMGEDFDLITAHRFLAYAQDENLRGNLLDLLEGNLILITDISTGISDLGHVSIEKNAPLVSIHASILNSLLTDTFYERFPAPGVTAIVLLAMGVIFTGACFNPPWVLFCSGAGALLGIAAVTWIEMVRFTLFPVATAGAVSMGFFFGMIVVAELITARDRKFIKNTFSKYMPEKVITQLLENPEKIRLGGEKREVTIFFVDIAGFTTISESLPPEQLVDLINEYFTEITLIIQARGGIIDKYLGDAVMAEFGMPIFLPDHAEQAVVAAIEIQKRLAVLQKKWAAEKLPGLNCRIGINTQEVIAGNMGAKTVFDYTVIGDGVNLASRLESANKMYGTSLIVSENTAACLSPDRFRIRIVDFVKVKGKSRPAKIYEIYGFATEPVAPGVEQYCRTYEKAFNAYLVRDFSKAEQGFATALALRPGDAAALKMHKRTRAMQTKLPPLEWDGSVSLMSK